MPNPIDNLPPAGSRPAATPFRMMMEDASHTGARIKVVGVGGAGGGLVFLFANDLTVLGTGSVTARGNNGAGPTGNGEEDGGGAAHGKKLRAES